MRFKEYKIKQNNDKKRKMSKLNNIMMKKNTLTFTGFRIKKIIDPIDPRSEIYSIIYVI